MSKAKDGTRPGDPRREIALREMPTQAAEGEAGVMVDVDYIEPSQPGSSQNHPYKEAPADMHENGLPYGAWCVCSKCNWVGRSTFVFDYYGGPGELLKCERCIFDVAKKV
jgi:hypothetical protein